MTSTDPIRGRTLDDGKEKPALYKLYDFTMGMHIAQYRYFTLAFKMKTVPM
jgi:hypothetical protein